MTQLKSFMMAFFLRCKDSDIDEERLKEMMVRLSDLRKDQDINLIEYCGALAADLAFMAVVVENALNEHGHIHEVMTMFNGVFGECYTLYKKYLAENPSTDAVEPTNPVAGMN